MKSFKTIQTFSQSAAILSAFLVFLVAWVAPASSQEAIGTGSSENTPESEKYFKRFAETASSLEFTSLDGDERYQLLSKPLFRFSTEGTVFGSVYIWHDSESRLAAIGTIGALPIGGFPTEFIELHLLKPTPIKPITLEGRPNKQWSPDVSDMAPRPIADAPHVAENERQRLTQMRAISRRFQSQMIHREQTNQLRLLPQPIYRYPESSVEKDGSLFAFVWDNGTDPELLLRIESTMVEGKPKWHYQPVRFTWRELRLSDGETEVWRSPEFFARDQPQQTQPYVTGLTEVLP